MSKAGGRVAVTELGGSLRGPLLAWPGRIETPGTVKRRLLLVASVMAIALSGVYMVEAVGNVSPWSSGEVLDMCGLPNPPANCAASEDGNLHQLSPEEFAQLQEIQGLIERFPVVDEFANVRPPGKGPRAKGAG
jgi:hypothetical protein